MKIMKAFKHNVINIKDGIHVANQQQRRLSISVLRPIIKKNIKNVIRSPFAAAAAAHFAPHFYPLRISNLKKKTFPSSPLFLAAITYRLA